MSLLCSLSFPPSVLSALSVLLCAQRFYNISYILPSLSLCPQSPLPLFPFLFFISSSSPLGPPVLRWRPHIFHHPPLYLSYPSLSSFAICAAFCYLAPFANVLSLLSFPRLIHPSLSSFLSTSLFSRAPQLDVTLSPSVFILLHPSLTDYILS